MEKIKLPISEQLKILWPYAYHNIKEQIIVVIPVCLYLALFQILILRFGFAMIGWLVGGIAMLIMGLTFFLEGIKIGLVPIGEAVGNSLPRRSSTQIILLFAFALGILGAIGEPVLGSLQLAGAQLKEEHAPILYRLLVRDPHYLVMTVAFGVGTAVFIGTLRFLFGWSLKPIVLPLLLTAIILTLVASQDRVLGSAIGLAWDTGAVIVGPVLCPLVLALGLGVCRATGKGDPSMAGFGMVGLISIMPIVSVMVLVFVLSCTSPKTTEKPTAGHSEVSATTAPSDEVHLPQELDFTASYPKLRALALPADLPYEQFKEKVKSLEAEKRTIFEKAYLIDDAAKTIVSKQRIPPDIRKAVNRVLESVGYDFSRTPFSTFQRAYEIKVIDERRLEGSIILRTDVPVQIRASVDKIVKSIGYIDWRAMMADSFILGLRAILPVFIFLFVVLRRLKEKGPQGGQIILSLFFVILGLFLFNFGLATGLSLLGNQSGDRVPVAFLDYLPLFPEETALYGLQPGKIIVVAFGLILGYGATLAEPAFNVLGQQVEDVTQGAFKKNLFGQAVALGVGVGAGLGLISMLYHINLLYLLLPPYVLLVILTVVNQEKFVNIAWDGGAVTTGPITVPLKLSLGLSLSMATGSGEGFGVIALASAYPVLNILLLGLYLGNKKVEEEEETD